MTQPPAGPPQGPPPWGNYPAPPSQPTPGRGWQIVCGAVIGALATLVLPVASIGLASSTGVGVFLVAFIVVPVIGIGLLFSSTTRPWGVGMLIGWALMLVIAGGACVALLSGLE